MYHIELSTLTSNGGHDEWERPESFGDDYGIEGEPRPNAFDTPKDALDFLDETAVDPYDIVYARRSRGGRVLLIADISLIRIKKED